MTARAAVGRAAVRVGLAAVGKEPVTVAVTRVAGCYPTRARGAPCRAVGRSRTRCSARAAVGHVALEVHFASVGRNTITVGKAVVATEPAGPGDTHRCCVGARRAHRSAGAAVGRVDRHVRAASAAGAQPCAAARDTSSCGTHLSAGTGVPTRPAVGRVGLGVTAHSRARRLPCETRHRARSGHTQLSARAGVPARAAVAHVGLDVTTHSRTHREPRRARRNAHTTRAHISARASVSAGSAVVLIGLGVTAHPRTSSLTRRAGDHTRSGRTDISARTNVSAGSAVAHVALQVTA